MKKKEVIQKKSENPFDIRDGRAMVSLGPLSQKKYCTYSCPFCYVHADFLSYATMTIDETIDWLKDNKSDFNIIYVSGDTDTFAAPRTNSGIELLERLTDFKVDILFTTRAVFNNEQLLKIGHIQNKQKENNKLLIGCVSIAQFNHQYLEPKPIPPPSERIEQLNNFLDLGLVSIFAMRPFLPVIPVEEYIQLINFAYGKFHILLGEVWYADKNGILEAGVIKDKSMKVDYSEHKMDFDENTMMWKVFEAKEIKQAVEKKCNELNIPFFMRSKPAIEWARHNFNKK